MNTIFDIDSKEWMPVIKYEGDTIVTIPDYYVNNKGQIYSLKSKRLIKPSINYHRNKDGSRGKVKNHQYSLSVPTDLFKDFQYHIQAHGKSSLVRLKAHIAVKIVFEPLDEYIHELGITKEEWEVTPESVKRIVRENAIIDHIDDDPSNNNITNLRWSTQRENSVYRKHASDQEYLREKIPHLKSRVSTKTMHKPDNPDEFIVEGDMIWNPLLQEYTQDIEFVGEQGEKYQRMLQEIADSRDMSFEDLYVEIAMKASRMSIKEAFPDMPVDDMTTEELVDELKRLDPETKEGLD